VFSRFFIDRPIFASVMSIMVTLAGGIALVNLPIAQYPEITPPTVEVSAIYPGANAKVVAATVAAPIEQQVNGVEGMMYMSSQCTNDGLYTLTVTFQHTTDLNMAQVMVQDRVKLAEAILPELVKRRGVAVKKKSPSVLMIVNLFAKSPHPRSGERGYEGSRVLANAGSASKTLSREEEDERKSLYLSNYATIQLKDELSRINGVGDITYIGQRDYSMRLWIDPQKLSSFGLSTSDIVNAITAQNQQVAAGQTGQPPIARGQVFQLTISTLGRLVEVEEFANTIIKSEQGRLVRLKDVAGIEMGAQSYDQTCTLDGRPSVALSIYQLPGSNALNVANSVRAKMEELKARFPSDIDYTIVYDTTPFINESIHEVFKTLRDAVILVAFVVLLFLQNWRSAIIPLVAVPVAIIGTFAVMAGMGFSLNNLTLFGLVLAIGIVVDDAIVVVEAVEHHIEHGLTPREATLKAMQQVSGPVIAVGLVLSAVFIPCAFITGITGQFFRQFALTIAVSTLISAFNSLTLSPALTALLLRPRDEGSGPPLPRLAFPLIGGWLAWELLPRYLAPITPSAVPEWVPHATSIVAGAVVGWIVSKPLNAILAVVFRNFNIGFNRFTNGYTRTVGHLLRVAGLVLLVYGGLLALTGWSFVQTPKGFIPQQDKGYLLVNLQLPDSWSVQRTREEVRKMEQLTREVEGVNHTVAISGQSVLLNANAPNFGSMYVMLDPFEKRLRPSLSADTIATRLRTLLQERMSDGVVNVFGAPPIDGLGTSGGFKIIIEDRGDLELKDLQTSGEDIVERGNDTRGLRELFTSFRANTPWLFLDIDRAQAKAMGVQISEVFNMLQVNLGSLYINDFNRFGRTWQVIAQAKGTYRKQIDELKQLRVKSDRGAMVPFTSFSKVKSISGPVLIQRYNLYPSVAINGNADLGVSSGQAIDLMQAAAQEDLPAAMQTEWTELALLQLKTGNTAMLVFLLGVVLVFLVLAAQYESWSLPLAVILVVPMCLLCSVAGVWIAQLDINIFTQVGFVVLIGLACKNAILIVEFAKAQREAGVDKRQATLEACKLRLRPIVMTSFAFILGVLPLVLAEGAGAEMRRTLGTAVFAGMIGVTLFGIYLTPVFFYVIQWLTDLVYGTESRRRELEEVLDVPPSPNGEVE
jgi:multidrug efflux pump subunit AcrB